jgi:hypothetical protein
MDWLKPPNPLDVIVSVVIGTSSYWGRAFVSAQVPVWTFPAMIGLGVVALLALGGIRRHRAANAERERLDEHRHRELMERLERLARGIEQGRG